MKTNFGIYSTKGLDTIGRNVVYATLQNSQEAAKTNVLFLEVENELNIYSPLVLKASTTGLSKEENAAMQRVQKSYKRLKNMVDANAVFPDSEAGKAAAALQLIFKRVGKLYRQKKGDMSASIENLLAELVKPEPATHIETLGLLPEAEALRAAKTAFDTIAAKRLDVKSELSQTQSASIARKKLEKALRNYLAFVTAMREVDGWQDLYSDLNEVMKAARLSVRQGKEAAIIADDEPAV
ncbi:MAG: DUF6261 family protein [Bacteroidia bacterium]|nr:DUF6261 family protein [Bacteroidia bacterium]